MCPSGQTCGQQKRMHATNRKVTWMKKSPKQTRKSLMIAMNFIYKKNGSKKKTKVTFDWLLMLFSANLIVKCHTWRNKPKLVDWNGPALIWVLKNLSYHEAPNHWNTMREIVVEEQEKWNDGDDDDGVFHLAVVLSVCCSSHFSFNRVQSGKTGETDFLQACQIPNETADKSLASRRPFQTWQISWLPGFSSASESECTNHILFLPPLLLSRLSFLARGHNPTWAHLQQQQQPSNSLRVLTLFQHLRRQPPPLLLPRWLLQPLLHLCHLTLLSNLLPPPKNILVGKTKKQKERKQEKGKKIKKKKRKSKKKNGEKKSKNEEKERKNHVGLFCFIWHFFVCRGLSRLSLYLLSSGSYPHLWPQYSHPFWDLPVLWNKL